MNYHRIKNIQDPFFRRCWNIYLESFPEEERRDLSQQEEILKKDNYFFMALLTEPGAGKTDPNGMLRGMDLSAAGEQALPCSIRKEEEEAMIPVGILAFWKFPCCIFGEHLAVAPHLKGGGLGKTAMEFMLEKARTEFPEERTGIPENEKGGGPAYGTAAGELYPVREHPHLPVILEIEIPADDISRRRENFYKRLGFETNSHKHYQPPFGKNHAPLEMLIMSWPGIIPEDLYECFYRHQKEIMPRFE